MKLYNCKKTVTLIIAIIMVFALTACSNASTAKQISSAKTEAGQKLFDKPTDISIVIGSHPSWPYNENWKMWQYFREASGANLKITAVPDSEMTTKVSLMMTSPDTLPDLLHLTDKRISDQYASDGAFVSIDDNLNNMNNYKKCIEAIPENKRTEILNQRRSADGKIYFTPALGNEAGGGLMSWMYRKDIFEKNNLTVPATMEEVYVTAKKLKKLYPDSFPLIFRDGLPKLDLIGPEWKNNFSSKLYYDFKTGKWGYGASEDTMRQMIVYFIKMYQEGLVPPNYITINTKTWEELVSTDKGYMMMDYTGRLDFFNLANRSRDPKYTWAVMAPPKTDSPQGDGLLTKLDVDMSGYLVCNTGNKMRINNAFKLLDWMFSDEGSELLSWGKEGETYRVVNGQKEFILGANEDPRIKYGVGTLGIYQRLDPVAMDATYSKEQAVQSKVAAGYLEDNMNPTNWMALNDEEIKIADEYKDALYNYTDEQISKFLLKQRPLSEWDAFQKELSDMHVKDLIDVYAKAYTRIMNSNKS